MATPPVGVERRELVEFITSVVAREQIAT